MQNHDNKLTKDSLRDLLRAVRHVMVDAWQHSRLLLIVLLIVSLFTALVPFAVRGVEALLLNHLVELYGRGQFDPLIVLLIVASAAVFLLQGSLYAMLRYFDKMSWFKIQQRHDVSFSEKLASLDIATHEDPKFQDQLQLVHEYGESFAVARVLDNLAMNAQNIVGVAVALTIVAIADWRFLIFILIASLPRFYAELRYGGQIWSIHQAKSEDRRLYREVKRQSQTATGVRELQTFQTTPFFVERHRKLLSDFLSAQQFEEKRLLGLQVLSSVLMAGTILVVLYVLISRVLVGDLQIGTFVFIFGAIIGLETAVSGFFLAIAGLQRDARPAKAFFDIMAREPQIKRPSHGKELRIDKAPIIEFRDVSFAYPGKPDVMVLEDFSLTIDPGERMAFVGVNGAGKSTLVKLMCRFYDPTEGSVLINGIDLREIDLESWYHHLALLAQDYQTYRFQAWELINLGRMNGVRAQDKVEQAAQRAQADSFIKEWELKYDTQIGVEFSGGIDPSGGQKQKLSLARALYRDAFVTVLDEPTAHVDAAAEQGIFDRLESEFGRDRTLLLISHRFSTVRNTDRVCVIENGRVKELGSHDDLVAHGGVYASLFKKQAEGYR